MTDPVYIESSAVFDKDRIYRYSLVRRWKPGPMVLWVMLNPSTADETVLDPTLRRCLGFTQRWGHALGDFGGFVVCNLYAFQSTDPKGLWERRTVDIMSPEGVWMGTMIVNPPDDPVGPGNDDAIREAAKACDLTIVGWGGNAKPERERKVAQLLHDIGVKPQALRLSKDGSPGHPLYLPGNTKPFPWYAKGLR